MTALETLRTSKPAAVPRKRFAIYFMLLLLAVVGNVDRITISVANQSIAREFGLSPVAMGYLLSAFFWSYLICLIPIGVVLDRWGARRTVGLCVAVWSLMTMAAGVVSSVSLMALTRLGLGISESVVFPAGGRVLRLWSPASERGIASTIFLSGSYIGPAFGAAFVAWMISIVGWRSGFAVAGAIGLIAFFIWITWYRDPEEAKWLDQAERQKILTERNLHDTSSVKSEAGSSVAVLLRSRSLWSLAIAHGCGIYCQYLYLTWLPSYLQTARGLTILNSGLALAIPYSTAAIVIVCIGWLSDRLLDAEAARRGRRRNIMILMSIISSVILLVPFINSTAGILAIITLSLCAMSGSLALHYALLQDLLLNPQNAGKAAAIVTVGGNTFGLSAPIITGYIINGTGSYNGAFAVAGVLLIAGAGLLLFARKPIDEVSKQ